MNRRMKRVGRSLSIAALIAMATPAPVLADFGDAVVGGVVGGVVGSVITNEVYRRHRVQGRHRTVHRHLRKKAVRTKKRALPSRPLMTDEKRIQQALAALGFYRGPIDGRINGYETRSAIRSLNKNYEIGDTAYLSPQERDALIYLGTLLEFDRRLSAGGDDRRTKGRRLQTALKILGFYHGRIDGAVGAGTRRAIAAYREANGLGYGTTLGFEEEYRLIDKARKTNDRNIRQTIDSLKHLGHSSPANGSSAITRPKPVILKPATTGARSAP